MTKRVCTIWGRLWQGLAIGLLMGVALGGGPADAQPITAEDPKAVARFLEAAGLKVEVATDSTGNPMLSVKAERHTYRVFFYGCTDGAACDSLQFYAGWSQTKNHSLEAINDWNRQHRYGRAYIDSVGDPCIEMDVETGHGGISPGLFADELEIWGMLLDGYSSYIYD